MPKSGRMNRQCSSVGRIAAVFLVMMSLLSAEAGGVWGESTERSARPGSASPVTPVASGSQPDHRAFDFRTWTIEDGLPENSITSITQTRDGYLWIGTFGGLARFDGVRFSVFDIANTEALDTNRILSLLETRNGDLWIGTEDGGVVRLRDGVFTAFRMQENAPRGKIFSIVEDREGGVWFGGSNLVRYADETFQEIPFAEDLVDTKAVRSLHIDSDDNLWMASDRGLGRFDDGRWQVVTGADGLSVTSAKFVGENSQGNVWAAGADWLAEAGDGEAMLTAARGDVPDQIYAAAVDSRGNHWIACRDGLLQMRHLQANGDGARPGVVFERVLDHSVTGPGGVRSVFEDREGSLWVGANGRGLIQMRQALFTSTALPADIRFRSASFLTAGANGGLWIWFGNSQVRRLTNDVWTTVPQLADLQRLTARVSGADGALWLAHDERWLSRLEDDQFTQFEHSLGRIESLLVTSGGSVFLGSSNALSVLRDGRITTMTVGDGLPPAGPLRLLTESVDGTIWAARDEAITGYRDGKFVHYTAADGLPPGDIRSMHTDDGGNLWIAMYGMGLARLRDGAFTRYTTVEGLPDNSLGKILADDEGNLWINSIRGVFRVATEELNAFAAGRISMVHCRSLRTGEGNNAGGVRTADGTLWFPTIDGVVRIDPRAFEICEVAPLVAIERVEADGVTVDHREAVRVGPGRGRLEIQYAALSFVEPENVRFRYKLEGYDEDWIEAGTRRTAFYTNIPPEAYRFRVTARNADGVWSEAEATIAVTMLPHFYQATWFWALCVFGVIATAVIGVGIRTRNVRRRYAVLQAEVNRRSQADAALRGMEQRFRLHLTNTPLAVIEWNLDLEVFAWNAAAEEIFGFTADAAMGRHLVGLLVPEAWREQVTAVWEELLAGRGGVRTKQRNITADGRTIFCDWYNTPLINDEGSVIGVASLALDVTDRENAAEALRLSEERFELATRGSSDGLWDWNIKTGEEWWSPQFREQVGLDTDELPASHEAWVSIVHPDDRKGVMEAMRLHLEEDEPYDIEYRMRSSEGAYHWRRVRGAAVRDENGNPVRMAGSNRDIDDRRRAQELLRESERQLSHAQAIAHIGHWRLDPKTGEVTGSDELFHIFGLSREEATIDAFAAVVHPDDREYDLYHINRGIEHGEAWDIEHRIIGRDGTEKTVHAIGAATVDENGKTVSLTGTVQDITDRKAAEEQRRQLAAAVASTGDAIVLTDTNNVIQYVNAAFTEMSGFSPEDVLGKTPRVYASGEYSSEFYARMWAVILRGEAWAGELSNRRKDGSLYETRLTIASVKDDHDRLIGFVSVQHDITERKRAEEQQKLLMRELDHRVKNNLAAVCALAQLTAKSADSPREFAGKFEDRIGAMAKVHEMLTKGHWEAVELADLVCLVLSPYAGQNGHVDWSGPLIHIHAAAAQPLALALHELATNAAKHGALLPRDGVVEVKWRHSGRQTVILDWAERTGSPLPQPNEVGLGLQLVSGFVEKELGGRFDIKFNSEGFACELELPVLTKE